MGRPAKTLAAHKADGTYREERHGSLEVPWDKLFGSFHDGTARADARMKERRKRIMGG